MQVILLERVDKLGPPGSEVSVKRGYARNWLLPQGKAVLATEESRQRAQKEHAQITAKDQAKKAEAEAMQQKLDGKEVILVRAAGESGQLYGSVRTQDIAEAIEQQLQIIVSKKLVSLEEPVRSTGIFSVPVRLHPQVPVAVSINVAPSEDEAKRQALKREALKHDQARQKQEQGQDKKEPWKKTKSTKTAVEDEAESEQEETEEKTEKTTAQEDEEGTDSKEDAKKKAKKSAEKDEEDKEKEDKEKEDKAEKEVSDKSAAKPSATKKKG